MLVVVVLALKWSAAHKCDSFEDVEMSVQPIRGEPYKTTINGCIERPAFENTIIEAYIRHQTIPRLGQDSVRNMKHLHGVQFYRCQISVIEPSAFRNVPSLRSIQIVANDLAEVPGGVFSRVPSLESLKLNSNKIFNIEEDGFGDLPLLKKIYLDHNRLEVWKKEWFTNTTEIDVMDFRYNQIKMLPKRAFSDLRRLREIYFDHNELESIQAEAFGGLKKLDYLGLRYNRLRSIDSKVFPNEVVIKSMMVDANYLNFLPKGLRTKLQVGELNIFGNPWKCPCLDQILSWLHQTNATVKTSNSCRGENVPVCSSPSTSSTCVDTVDEEVTETYLQGLRKLKPPLDKYCARLD
ncbi:LRR 8 domain containing protein [Asbolus verrucosus]|uniref:LRR 8 domain containing protein n=1 Tax=Asbolus verrucosus TaxID=1661398 RepID=A0A482W4B7_ASBVE|nr:LRR 8 domain containing protein [Asbolus verrucosus]